MIAHLLLFTPKPALGDGTRRELAAAFSDLVRTVPAIRRARVGRRVSLGRAYEHGAVHTHAAILEFDDRAGLEAYLVAPAHERLAGLFFASVEQVLVYDLELDEGDGALERLVDDE